MFLQDYSGLKIESIVKNVVFDEAKFTDDEMLELAKALSKVNGGEMVQSVIGYRDSHMFLKEEFEVSMALMGTSSIEQINNSYIYQK